MAQLVYTRRIVRAHHCDSSLPPHSCALAVSVAYMSSPLLLQLRCSLKWTQIILQQCLTAGLRVAACPMHSYTTPSRTRANAIIVMLIPDDTERFEAGFPADFIAEGLDQTRGWFYTLSVLSTALFDKPPFKNLVVNGLVLAEDGKKMSKRLKNYPDPNKFEYINYSSHLMRQQSMLKVKVHVQLAHAMTALQYRNCAAQSQPCSNYPLCIEHPLQTLQVIDQYGADALRLYLIDSPVVRAEPLRFREAGVLSVVKDVLLPWFNTLRFFTQQVYVYTSTHYM
eukprot:1536-Heterococcus_DN1.PRE.2